MHERKQNFDHLIRKFPELREKALVIGQSNNEDDSIPTNDSRTVRHRLDWTDESTLRCLSKAILLNDFSVDVDLPADRLCPPIPNRLEYIDWIAKLIHASKQIDSTENNLTHPNGVHVLDIGVGASCIYPLIGVSKYGWHFTGSDIDKSSLECANTNVIKNQKVSKNISLVLVEGCSLLQTDLLAHINMSDNGSTSMVSPSTVTSTLDYAYTDHSKFSSQEFPPLQPSILYTPTANSISTPSLTLPSSLPTSIFPTSRSNKVGMISSYLQKHYPYHENNETIEFTYQYHDKQLDWLLGPIRRVIKAIVAKEKETLFSHVHSSSHSNNDETNYTNYQNNDTCNNQFSSTTPTSSIISLPLSSVNGTSHDGLEKVTRDDIIFTACMVNPPFYDLHETVNYE